MLELLRQNASLITAAVTIGGWLFALGVWRGDYRQFKNRVLEDLRLIKAKVLGIPLENGQAAAEDHQHQRSLRKAHGAEAREQL